MMTDASHASPAASGCPVASSPGFGPHSMDAGRPGDSASALPHSHTTSSTCGSAPSSPGGVGAPAPPGDRTGPASSNALSSVEDDEDDAPVDSGLERERLDTCLVLAAAEGAAGSHSRPVLEGAAVAVSPELRTLASRWGGVAACAAAAAGRGLSTYRRRQCGAWR